MYFSTKPPGKIDDIKIQLGDNIIKYVNVYKYLVYNWILSCPSIVNIMKHRNWHPINSQCWKEYVPL